jgi:hypothetical protein
MADQPLALQWLCFIRDHGLDLKVTQGERALASLLPTYGQGRNIFVSTAKLTKITGWSENTVRKARNGLIAKGLLEDITGDPDRQLRTYRLTMPGYVSGDAPEGRVYDSATPSEFDPSPSISEGVPPQNLTPSPSESDPYIKPLDQDLDQAFTSSSGDGGSASPEGHRQTQGAGPTGQLLDSGVTPSVSVSDGDFPADGEAVEPHWIGNGKDAPGNRAWLADLLGVPVGSVGAPLWRWLESLGLDCEANRGAMTGAASTARASARPGGVVGYFRTILPGYLESAAEEDAAQVAANPFGPDPMRDAEPWEY